MYNGIFTVHLLICNWNHDLSWWNFCLKTIQILVVISDGGVQAYVFMFNSENWRRCPFWPMHCFVCQRWIRPNRKNTTLSHGRSFRVAGLDFGCFFVASAPPWHRYDHIRVKFGRRKGHLFWGDDKMLLLFGWWFIPKDLEEMVVNSSPPTKRPEPIVLNGARRGPYKWPKIKR